MRTIATRIARRMRLFLGSFFRFFAAGQNGDNFHRLEKVQKTLVKEAEKDGYGRQPSAQPLQDQHQATVNQCREEDTGKDRVKEKELEARQKEVQAEVESFDMEQNTQACKTDMYREQQAQRVQAEAQAEKLEGELHDAEIRQEEAEDRFNQARDKYGEVSRKGFLDFMAFLVVLVVIGYDVPVSAPVLVSFSFPPIAAWLGALTISVFLGVSAHALADAIVRGFRWRAFIWSLVGSGIITAIAVVRLTSEDHQTFVGVTIGLLALFWLAAALLSLRYLGRKSVRERDQERKAEAREVNDLSASLSVARANAADLHLPELSDQAASQRAQDKLTALCTNGRKLSYQLASLQARIAQVNSRYDQASAEGKAAIQRAFEKGRHKRRPKKSFLQKVRAAMFSVLFFTLAGCSCDNVGNGSILPDVSTQYYDIQVLIDRSGSMEYQITPEKIRSHIVSEIAHLDEEFMGRRSVRVRFYVIGENSNLYLVSEAKLPLGAAYALRDVPAREDTLEHFTQQKLLRAAEKAFRDTDAETYTNLHRGSVKSLEKLAKSKATHKYQILISDGVEESYVLSLADYAGDPARIRKEQDQLIATMLEDTPLPSGMSDIQMLFICQGTHKELSYQCGNLFQTMWEQGGIGEVEIVSTL